MAGDKVGSGGDWWARTLAVVSILGTLWGTMCGTRELERVKAQLNRQQALADAQWQAKRQACLDALDVIDAYFTTRKWTVGGKDVLVQGVERVNIRKIRSVYNRLAVSVTDGRVLALYRQALLLAPPGGAPPPPVGADLIIDLRNAIRKELFDAAPIEESRDLAWIARIDAACTDADQGCPQAEK